MAQVDFLCQFYPPFEVELGDPVVEPFVVITRSGNATMQVQ